MKNFVKFSLNLLISMLLIGLSACAPQTAFEGQAFTSEKFGYSLLYPAGWLVKDKPGEWAEYDPLDPKNVGGIDAFAGYVDGRNLAIGVGARDLADADLASWVETAKSLIKAGVSKGVCYEGAEDDPISEEAITLGGEPAMLLEYHCPNAHDSFGLVALSTHNGRGYWITWISAQGNADADKAEFIQVLNTFSFID
jgi:hypothetical protein